VDLVAETVTFERIEERQRAYIDFVSHTLNLLREEAGLKVRESSPAGLSWHILASLPENGRQKAVLAQSFARGQRFRVELYLDTGDESATKKLFDRLATLRPAIEADFGEALSWERMDDRRACRIAAYKAGSITSSPSQLRELQKWGVDTLVKLRAAINGPFIRAMEETEGLTWKGNPQLGTRRNKTCGVDGSHGAECRWE
jgi:hypothetical protein